MFLRFPFNTQQSLRFLLVKYQLLSGSEHGAPSSAVSLLKHSAQRQLCPPQRGARDAPTGGTPQEPEVEAQQHHSGRRQEGRHKLRVPTHEEELHRVGGNGEWMKYTTDHL